jgi:YesN/AraC family two-component response regulator
MLTDVVMPGMTGKELAERQKALRPEMKVLYTSGYTDDVIARRGILEPGMFYIPKPYSPQALAEKVRAVLGSH